MTKLQQVNKIVIKMLNKHENLEDGIKKRRYRQKVHEKYTKNEQLMSHRALRKSHGILCCYLLKMLYEKKYQK